MKTEWQRKLDEAINAVFYRLNALSTEELREEIKRYAEENPEKVESIRRAMVVD